MSITQEAAQLARAAGDWLDTHNHMKHLLFDNPYEPLQSRHACLRGALIIAALENRGEANNNSMGVWFDTCYDARELVEGTIVEALGLDDDDDDQETVVAWNNAPERTKEEVVKAFYTAADLLEVSDDPAA